MENEKQIEENEHYSITLAENKKTFVLNWKHIMGFNVQSFQKDLTQFAVQCKAHKPTRVVIDARKLAPSSPALVWVSGQQKAMDEEGYIPWWTREIVPIYHDAGISSIAVATGDPNAPGEVDVPPGVHFKMGYFPNFEDAMQWETL